MPDPHTSDALQRSSSVSGLVAELEQEADRFLSLLTVDMVTKYSLNRRLHILTGK